MTNYPEVYKLKENGRIYTWKIELKEYQDKFYTYVTHGQKDGKIIEHIKEIVPKGNRNYKEQFEIIASRKWNDKVKKEGYSTNINNENNQDSDSDYEEDILIRPMLAQTFDKSKYEKNKKCKKIVFPCWGQPKYDGIRCLMYLKKNDVIMESRKGTEFYNFEVLREEFMNTLSKEKNCIFDGELFTQKLPFEKISGLVRRKTLKEDQINDLNQIEYHIYDVIFKNNLNATYDERKDFIDNLQNKYNTNLIKFCPSEKISTLRQVETAHSKYVNMGFEGLILRNSSGIYEVNKRSYDLQKYKHFMDEEFDIIDFTEGTGDEKGLIIFICETKSGKTFSVRPKGNHEYRKELFDNGDYLIGKKLTVMFQEYSGEGVPRFPVGITIRDYE